jgi:Flp pilus assembly protein CpaB
MENLLPKGMLGTPRRAVILGVIALVLAAVLLLVYLRHYRDSVKSSNSNVPVLRAKVYIPKGTTAVALAKTNQFEVASIPKDQLVNGAITDAGVLHGQVAVEDIFPGQQLTTADFGVTPLSTALSGSQDLLGSGPTKGTWRALAVNPDAVHGLTPQVQTGDHVDIYVAFGTKIGLLAPDVLVLAAPNQSASGTTAATSANYILRVPSRNVVKFASSQDNGKLWFALRPQRGAKPTLPTILNDTNFLTGIPRG